MSVHQKFKKGLFSQEKDQTLINFVAESNVIDWKLISNQLGRTVK